MARKKPTVTIVEETYDEEELNPYRPAEPTRSEASPFSAPRSEPIPVDVLDKAIHFKATKKQIMAKLRFHKHAPANLKKILEMHAPVCDLNVKGQQICIVDYIPGISDLEFMHWLEEDNFWPWFLIDDDVDIALYAARQEATRYLMGVMQLDEYDPEKGKVDLAVVNTKMRVARMIIDKDVAKTTVNKTSNNVNMFGGGLGGNGVPKHLAKQPISELESRARALTEGAENDE